MNKHLEFIWDSFKGRRRTSNKDDVSIIDTYEQTGILFVIFDGVSSLTNAKHGINIAKKFLKYNSKLIIKNYNSDIKGILNELNNKILSINYDKPFSTCSILFYTPNNINNIKAASIGDSRIYKLTNQYLEQITVDDRLDGDPNIITKYLGMDELFSRDIKEINTTFVKNEKILMCTDGFYNIMDSHKIKFLKALNEKKITRVRDSIKKLIEGHNDDDATYILIRGHYV